MKKYRYVSLFIAIAFIYISVVYANQIKNNKIRVFNNCYVSYIDEEKLFINGEKYILSPDLIITENQDYKIDKQTVAGVGFISRANVVVKKSNDKREVIKIIILEMQQ